MRYRSLIAYCLLLCLLCTCILPGITAWAAMPELTGVFPSDETVTPGGTVDISYEASVPGTLRIEAHPLDKQGNEALLQESAVPAGRGVFTWDGRIAGAAAAAGRWAIRLTLSNDDGGFVFAAVVDVPGEVTQTATAAETATTSTVATATADSAPRPKVTPSPDRQLSEYPDPHENCYWQMDIDNLDPRNEADQAIIWEIMMQPITVLDANDPKAHVYPLITTDADPKDAKNSLTGQLHCKTQGVHVIETLDNGWSLIEAYTNDGYGAPTNSLRNIGGKLISGYVRTEKLKTVKPNEHIALLIDKLSQRLYVFQDGKMTGELLISTGKPTKDQPWNETPAGEFLTDSWVGEFVNGNMLCDLAIRINGGVLLHEVPHRMMADGTPDYEVFEKYLGQKASHGCVRIQRKKNAQGMNMRWLWDNLKRSAKVLVWDDKGRSLPPPDPDLPVFYNPDGGKNYHLDQNCPYVKDRFLPLTGITYADLFTDKYKKLTPCATCNPPSRHDDPSVYAVPDDVIGQEDGSTETDQEVDGGTQ